MVIKLFELCKYEKTSQRISNVTSKNLAQSKNITNDESAILTTPSQSIRPDTILNSTHTHTHTRAHTHTHTHTHIYIYTYTYTHMHTQTDTNTHTYTNTHIYS